MSAGVWFALGLAVGVALMAAAVLAGPVHVHRWSRWAQVGLTLVDDRGGEMRVSGQSRVCSRCGRKQTRQVGAR